MSGTLNYTSYKCIHNEQGQCSAQGIVVEEFVLEDGNIPFCNTYMTQGVMNCLRNSAYGGTCSPSAYGQDFQSSAHKQVECSVTSCAYCRDLQCCASQLHIDRPESDASTLSACMTYQRRDS